MMNIRVLYPVPDQLSDAALHAETDAEKNFVAGIQDRFDRFGDESVFNDRQREQLHCIANPECPHTYGPSGLVMEDANV